MICPFFKFSARKHFYSPKLIAWVDIRVVLIFYSFQSVRVGLKGELEKWTKYTKSQNIQNSCQRTLTAYTCGKIAPHPYVSHIFGKVLISSFTWSARNWSYDMKITTNFNLKKIQISIKILYFSPNPNCKLGYFKILSLLVHFLYDLT